MLERDSSNLLEKLTPYLGQLDSIEYVDEIKLEFMISENEKQITEQAIINYHPYETPVYDFIKLQNKANLD